MRTIPRLVVAGVSSGVGKTTVTIALARAWMAQGLRVALFKCGPDYLDPTYHACAVGHPSHNLDGWMMGREAVRSTFAEGTRDADVALIEGVMGLFDGATATGDEGSTAQIAKWLDAPVVLVTDASGMARSIAALVSGFARFDRDLNVAGAIANRVGSRGHADLLRKALGGAAFLGALPRDPDHAFQERHLGLKTAHERDVPQSLLDKWGEHAAAWIDVDAVLACAQRVPPLEAPVQAATTQAPSNVRIGIAHDEAFHFYYIDNLRQLEAAGAKLVRFSPVNDSVLPDVDGLYLGGGYPEVFAAELAANEGMRTGIAEFAAQGRPIYAECGGLMVLSRAIRTHAGCVYPMVGVLPTAVQTFEKLHALGYVEVETQIETLLGPAGTRFRGHEFRYSDFDPPPWTSLEPAYHLRKRRGGEVRGAGVHIKNVLASYVHAHWASNPAIPQAFVDACRKARTHDGGDETT